MKPRYSRLLSTLVRLAYFSALLALAISMDPANAQNPDCRTPDHTALSTAFPQNAHVTVNINSNTGQFTQADFDCMKAAFENWNTANNANSSHVTFTVNFSPTVLVTTDSTGHVTSASSSNVYQVNRDTTAINSIGVGVTGGQGTNSGRTNAFTNIHPNVTACDALTQTMAHQECTARIPYRLR